MDSAKLLLKHYRAAVRRPVFLAQVAGSAHGLFVILQLAIAALGISLLVQGQSQSVTLFGHLVLFLLFTMGRVVTHYLQQHFGLRAGEEVKYKVRQDLIRSFNQRAGENPDRAASSLIAEPIEQLAPYFSRFLPQQIIVLIVPAVILAVVFYLNWVAGVFLLLAAPLIPVFMAIVGMGAERIASQHMESLARISGIFIDRIRNLATLRVFGAEQQATQEVETAAEHYRQLNMKTLKVAFLSSAVLEFFSAVAIAAVAIYIGFSLLGYFNFGPSESLGLFEGLFILMLAPEYFQPLRTLAVHYHDRSNALGAAEQLSETIQSDNSKASLLLRLPVDRGQVNAGPLSFSYADDSYADNNESETSHQQFTFPELELESGEVLLIQGESGSGKSTWLKLIAGLYSPQLGDVQIDGMSASNAQVAYLTQRPFVLHGTLAENLLFVVPDANETAMKQALEKSGLSELLAALPEGLNTVVGESGVGLSGGETRRLALARIFLSDVPVVVLDEPTAGLDSSNSEKIVHALRQLRGNRTLIIASHDPLLAELTSYTIKLKQSSSADEEGGANGDESIS